jgi:sec-independent protein translocase protein TatB
MIDLGLSKLAIIGVVALVVIGPEKLPKVARMAGSLYGRAQRYLHDVKTEVSREMELDELRNLKQHMADIHDTANEIKADVENTIQQNLDDVDAAWRDLPSSDTPPHPGDIERKARDFRRKKLVRNSAVPNWYKQRHGAKMRILSGAARVKKFRPGGGTSTSSFF